MLGYIISEKPGQTDALLQQVADTLIAEGRHLRGAVQHTGAADETGTHEMTLHLLPDGPSVSISQFLGKGATGCTLDPDGLERAAAMIAATLDSLPDLLLLNKFGKQEAEGRGFRPLIGMGLMQNIPVLIGVGRDKLAAFETFADGMAVELPKDIAALTDWARTNARA